MGIPAVFLWVGVEEVKALAALLPQEALKGAGPLIYSGPLPLSAVRPPDLARMLEWVGTGMLKVRLRATHIRATAARNVSLCLSTAPVLAGTFSAILPGVGTLVGTALGHLLSRTNAVS